MATSSSDFSWRFRELCGLLDRCDEEACFRRGLELLSLPAMGPHPRSAGEGMVTSVVCGYTRLGVGEIKSTNKMGLRIAC